jgi:hypothetical protein
MSVRMVKWHLLIIRANIRACHNGACYNRIPAMGISRLLGQVCTADYLLPTTFPADPLARAHALL